MPKRMRFERLERLRRARPPTIGPCIGGNERLMLAPLGADDVCPTSVLELINWAASGPDCSERYLTGSG